MAHDDLKELERLFPYILEYQKLADKHNISDIFQDNGGKLLQLLLVLNLKTSGSREGNDAYDSSNNEFELKTVNIKLTKSFSTHHHLNPVIIEKYKKVYWYFALYCGIALLEIWKLSPKDLQPYYEAWGEKWKTDGDINNPKIPVSFVRKTGELIYQRSKSGVDDCPQREKKKN